MLKEIYTILQGIDTDTRKFTQDTREFTDIKGNSLGLLGHLPDINVNSLPYWGKFTYIIRKFPFYRDISPKILEIP